MVQLQIHQRRPRECRFRIRSRKARKSRRPPPICRLVGTQQRDAVRDKQFDPLSGAEGWQISNINVLSTAPLLASLDLFDDVGMQSLREKSLLLTGYLEYLLDEASTEAFTIISPRNREERGCQLSLQFGESAKSVHKRLNDEGIICDYREPGVIRVAPVPFYNSFMDVFNFVEGLKKLL